MARNDIPNGWDKIRQNVQETERLMGKAAGLPRSTKQAAPRSRSGSVPLR